MPRPRKHLVCLDETPYYHVTARCVRRAFLCGIDRDSGRSYEHRRDWIETRLRVLSSLFSVDVCAYAIMSNHYHLVVRIDGAEPDTWSDDDVLERWTSLFKGPLLVQRYRDGEMLTAIELDTLKSTVAVFRRRLGSLSWFMKCMNEPIARKANAEDRCTGHFWEARFHSQALCSERALIKAMVYVDLNPIRAKIAETPEDSDFTSVRARIQVDRANRALLNAIRKMTHEGELNHFATPLRPLMAFASKRERRTSSGRDPRKELPIQETDYLTLVDATGRVLRQGKRGRIPATLDPLLIRLGVKVDTWIEETTAPRSRSGKLLRTA